MSYAIDERNPERQQLLAKLLEPPTRTVLTRLPSIPGARVLALGCGQGNTTRRLAGALQPGECIGVEFDATLVEYAQTRPDNPASVRFQQGDATQLPFPDASFDVAFGAASSRIHPRAVGSCIISATPVRPISALAPGPSWSTTPRPSSGSIVARPGGEA